MMRLERRAALLVALSLLASAATASAADYSAATHFYMIEYLKPFTGGPVTTLNIVLNRQLQAQDAERILREELQRAVNLFPPKGEVMAYAWLGTGPRASEKAILLPDGSHFLIYSPISKQVQPGNSTTSHFRSLLNQARG